MPHTITEQIGMMQETIAYMQDADNQALLKSKDFDAAPHVTRLQSKLDSITQLRTEEEQLKVQLHQNTQSLNTALDEGYRDTSGVLDAMIGILGKGSTAAENLRRLRSRIRRANTSESPTPPAPAKA